MRRWFVALLLALVAAAPGVAADALPLAEDPVVEARLVKISEELRCLVCQNESLAGSRAGLADDLRREIRELIRQGKSDAEIRDFMVQRYGDFVLYRPPFKATTVLLWVGPFVLLLVGLLTLLRFLKRRPAAPTPLSPEEAQRAAALLREDH